MNHKFKYRSMVHAFSKEIKENGAAGLYRGSLPFLLTYCSCISLQFAVYESVMAYYKKIAGSEQEYLDNENRYNLIASFLGGSIGSGLTNVGDVLTVNKQTQPDIKLYDLI
jgi:hypothetical protein